jgi:hypothetical protein
VTTRHPLLVGSRWLVVPALAFALVGAIYMPSLVGRIAGLVVFVLVGVGAWAMRLSRLVLRLDDDGWAIEQRGRERVRVKWSDVQRVRIDKRESALYVDCGDKARNLLVPPRRGYGFRFADAPTICARVLATVPAERVVEVERIDVS